MNDSVDNKIENLFVSSFGWRDFVAMTFVAVMLLSLTFVGWMVGSNIAEVQNAEAFLTEGRTVSAEYSDTHTKEEGTVFAEYEYVVDGETFTYTEEVNQNEFVVSEGETVELCYVPGRPQISARGITECGVG